MPWSELERRLSGRPRPRKEEPEQKTAPGTPSKPTVTPYGYATRHQKERPRPWEPWNYDGDGSPGWERHPPYEAHPDARTPQGPVVPYAELHAHSDFSFLDGAGDPEALIEEAVRLGLHALALTDHDGFYGVSRFAEAARQYPIRTVFGAELSLGLRTPQNGVADPEGSHLLVLAAGVAGYHRLAGAITEAQLRGDEKGRPVYHLEELAEQAHGDWMILTGCRKGAVRQALAGSGGRPDPDAAGRELDRLTALFGRDHVTVELTDHRLPTDTVRNDALAALAAERGLPVLATNNVHYPRPDDYRLASAMAAVRARRSLTEMDGWLPPPTAFLRSGAEMAAAFARYPGAVAYSVTLAEQLAFDLKAASPRLPKQEVPEGHTPISWLRELTREGADRLYPHQREKAQVRLDKELAVIEAKDFPGYFLIVYEMVRYAKEKGILCQGRGSAANSVVCYTLGITAVDPILYDLPFERFLASTRDEEPDIDVDFDSERREEVIQEVYRRYGRRNAAQVANVIAYRPKSAVRDMAKALGYSTGQQDAWSKQIDSWTGISDDDHDIPAEVVELANQLLKAPRHLGIHSGGMVLTEQPVGEVCPIERGRMDDRTVLQWDKDSCAWMGLVKFDMLGLGILNAIQQVFDLVGQWLGETWKLETLPKEEPAVYDMVCRADSVGLFQVESRAQIGTLPRLQPRRFYDLVIEVALIRPGPIQGGAVHPFIRRSTGKEPVTYPHPALEPVLERTKGVPLFQEQLMQIAMTVGGCTGDEADLLRRAMGSKRGVEKIEMLRRTLFTGMAEHGITGDLAEEIYDKIVAFANFGFAESHACSFALLVYASAWLKLHYPAAYLAGLLRAQPMGFYSPQSLVTDARRHGVMIRRPDILRSGANAGLEPLDETCPEPVEGPKRTCPEPVEGPRRTCPEPVEGPKRTRSEPVEGPTSSTEPVVRAPRTAPLTPTGLDSCLQRDQPPVGRFDRDVPDPTPTHRRDGACAVRMGLDSVQGIGLEVAKKIVAERERAPFTSITDLVRRTGLSVKQTEALATAGAFDGFGISRRQALWSAGYTDSPDQLEGTAIDAPAPELPGMTAIETTLADLWATSVSPDEHPMAHLRTVLDRHQVVRVGELGPRHDTCRVRVAGLVTHRQRPGTAGGVTFLNLEDETGMLNVVCSAALWSRYRRVARNSAGMIIRGVIEHKEGVTNLVADRLDRLSGVYPEVASMLPARHASRDFR
ncbi:error-prone DNA polymerase [Friedmanniella endophytica]|uniref:Error-prone DNA polymerase n=2 Tax=Microlunatus kandeliicorticis TaxID=1759536 RepID=A0A7W3ITU7_9ACTN|nr:error-prone DNA polymerase [Microlunatus kandeliicorticis]MBA8795124.1 error-prone DNA polymerase [Microlunatus kandeliicorticis]